MWRHCGNPGLLPSGPLDGEARSEMPSACCDRAGQALRWVVAELVLLTAPHCSLAGCLLHMPACCTPVCARGVRGLCRASEGRTPIAPRWRSGGAPRLSALPRARQPRQWWPESAQLPGQCCSPAQQPSCLPGPLPDGQCSLQGHNRTLKRRQPTIKPSSQRRTHAIFITNACRREEHDNNSDSKQYSLSCRDISHS